MMMRTLFVSCLLVSVASAQPSTSPSTPPTPTPTPPAPAALPSDQPEPEPEPESGSAPALVPSSSSEPMPPPAPAPAPEPAPAPHAATTTAPAAATTKKAPTPDDYYSRQRGLGIFHRGRLALGLISGDATVLMDGAPAMTEARTIGSLSFDVAYLQLPSSFGNFHGIETSLGLRGAPFDMWMQAGSAFTLLNVGRGGIGSLRAGGGFGIGFNLAHGYAYLRARAAIVLIPRKVDAEVSVQWSPTSASTHHYDEQTRRASLWIRTSKSKQAYEVYVESYKRLDPTNDTDREIEGIGGGVGIAR